MELYLRIKRPAKTLPVEFFETDHLFKRTRRCDPPSDTSVFQYIGSNKSTEASASSIGNLEILLAKSEAREIRLKPHEAVIKSSDLVEEQCSMEVKMLKRLAEQDQQPDSSLPAMKRIKVVDVAPIADNLERSINKLRLSSDSNPANNNDGDEFFYDLYKCLIDPDRPLLIDDHPLDQNDREGYVDDDEDSNSESHWRNDYPDEISSSSCSSRSSSSRRSSDCYENGFY